MSFVDVVGGIGSPDVAWRTFASGNPEYPDTWSVGTNETNASSGNSKVNYDSGSITTTDKMLIQAGFKYSTTGAQYGIADIIAVAKK